VTATSHRVVLVNLDGSSVPWSAHTTNIGAQRMVASLTKSPWRHQSAALRARWSFHSAHDDDRVPWWATRADALGATDRLMVDADALFDVSRMWFESAPASPTGHEPTGRFVDIILTAVPGEATTTSRSLPGELYGWRRLYDVRDSNDADRSHRSYLGDMIAAATLPARRGDTAYIPTALIVEALHGPIAALLGAPGGSWSVRVEDLRDAVMATTHILDLRHPPHRSGSPGTRADLTTSGVADVAVDSQATMSAAVVAQQAGEPAQQTGEQTARVGSVVTLLDRALDEQVVQDLADSAADATWRAYRSDLTNLDAWLDHRDWTDPAMIADYLRHLETGGASYSTIERRVTSITKLANVLAVIGEFDPTRNPAKHPTVTTAMAAIRRRLGTNTNGSAPLTAERLIQVLGSIDDTTRAGRRDIALLLIGWYGAFRRSELAGIRLQHLDIDNHGAAISLARTKAAQDHTVWVPIARNPTSQWCPVTKLEQWISELDELDDSVDDSLTVWPWITKGDTVHAGNPPIGGAAIDAIVSRRVANSGLANASSYSAHSLRSGFITEAKNRGVDEADIMRHTRLKSLRIMRLYDRTTGWWNRNPTTSMTL